MELFTITSAQTNWILPQFICSSNYLQNLKIADSGFLVINIGEISNITHFISQMLKVSEENIKGDIDASMADMAEIICGDAAHVHSHFTLHFGFKQLFLPTHRIVQP